LQRKAIVYKVLKSIDFVSSLPHTEIGKVNKVKVREMFGNAAGGQGKRELTHHG
jgi:acyl-coenzyme A synthetase/AMP-(fatty) acid ligase